MQRASCPGRAPNLLLPGPDPGSGLLGQSSLHLGGLGQRGFGFFSGRLLVLFLLLLLAFLGVVPATAQIPVSRFGRLTVEDGLPHSAIFSIAQGPSGFLWLATQTGLCRWDGYGCRVFRHDPEDPTSLPSDIVSDMAVDGQGELWCGTQEGLARFDRASERFERWSHDPDDPRSLPNDRVYDLLVDRRGTLWVGTHRGMARFDPESRSFVRIGGGEGAVGRGPGHLTVADIYEDEEGTFWIGTFGGLFQCDPETWQCQVFRHDPEDPTSLTHDLINDIAEDAVGDLWIATGGGLSRFLPETRTFERPFLAGLDLGKLRIFELLTDRRGDLWVGTANHGLVRIPANGDGARGFLHDPGEPDSLIGNRILSMAEDSRGNLWFGTYVGVSNWVPYHQQFATFRQRPGQTATLSGNNISALLESDEDTLWVGTWDRGLNRLDRGSAQVTQFHADPSDPHSLPDETVTSLLIDRRGDLWVGTWGGLARWDFRSQGFEVVHSARGEPPIDTVNAVHEDQAGQLWVGHIAGLARFDPRSRHLVALAEDEGVGEKWVRRIAESADGSLWLVGTFQGLLRRAPAANQFEPYRATLYDPGCEGEGLDLLFQKPGKLWVVTDAGLIRFDLESDRSTCYPDKQFGGHLAQMVSITEASDGSLWMGSDRGLRRFDPASEGVESYGFEDGLQSSVFSTRSAFASPRGELFFGGIRGFNAFYPEQLQHDKTPPTIMISGLWIHDRLVGPRAQDPESPLEQSILETTELVLDYHQATVTFELAALDFAAPRSTRYAYRMEGLESQWVEADAERRFARYVQLPSGRYTFRARAGNRDEVWGDERVLRIVVEPAFWRGAWAYATYALLGMLVVTAYVRSQRRKLDQERAVTARERDISRRLREMDRIKDRLLGERQRLVDDLRMRNEELAEISVSTMHDLTNPLTTIQAYLGSIRRDHQQGRSDRIGELARISSSTPACEPLDLGSLIRRKLGELGLGPKTEVSIGAALTWVEGDPSLLEILIEQLLRNAQQNASSSRPLRLEIKGRIDEDRLVLEMRDNGKGVDPRYHRRVFKLFESFEPVGPVGSGVGLSLARRIVELHGGQIRLESTGPDQGTAVVFDLPLDKAGEQEPEQPALAE